MPNLLACALVAFDEPTLDLNDVECMCVSLIDQVSSFYLRGPFAESGFVGLLERLYPAFFRIPSSSKGSANIWFSARIECNNRIE